VRRFGVALRRGIHGCGSGLVTIDGSRRRKKGSAIVADQAEAIGELLGELARGAAHALLDLLNRIHGTVGPLRQRLLRQVVRLAQPFQQPTKREISVHGLSI
jgi:hypothetical protein